MVLTVSGLKANVSEAEHPLLCEGTRRQRGDLAMSMLVHYKDNQVKLSKVGVTSHVVGCCGQVGRVVDHCSEVVGF